MKAKEMKVELDTPDLNPNLNSGLNMNEVAAMVAARREGGLWRSLNDVRVIAWRNILSDFREPASLIVSSLFSMSLFLVFTASFARVVTPESGFAGYARFLMPFTIIQGLLFNTVEIGVFFYNDLENGMDVRLRAMPIARLAAIGGRLVSAAVRLLVQSLAIVVSGYLIGFRFNGSFLETVGFFTLPIIFTLSVALIGFYIAVGAKSAETVSAVMNPWILPFTFMSLGYVPASGFPDWALGFVRRNPVSTLAEAMRGMANGEQAIAQIVTILLWSLALCLIFGTLTVRNYQRRI